MARPNSQRKFKPGSRNKKGRISDGREAWVKFIGTELILYSGGALDEDVLAEDALTETLRLHLYAGSIKKWGFNLTTLTEAELNAFENFMRYAFDRARPLVIQRDKEAQEAMANGDDSFARSYRQVPQFVVRSRTEREHDQGLRERPDGVPEVGEAEAGDRTLDTGSDRDRLQRVGDDVAQRVQVDAGSQNNGSQADQPEGVGEVGKMDG